MCAVLRKLPAGTVTAHTAHDPFPGTPPDGIPITAKLTVDPVAAGVEVDLTDNPDCLPCGLNLSEACARTAAMIGVFNSIGPGVPPNAGSFRRVAVKLRENCVVGIPRHPTSCSVATTNVADRVSNVVQRAIATLADGYGMAEAGTSQSASNAIVSGQDPRTGAAFCNQVILADTCGQAAPSEDAWLTMGSVGVAGICLWDSIEVDEIHHPDPRPRTTRSARQRRCRADSAVRPLRARSTVRSIVRCESSSHATALPIRRLEYEADSARLRPATIAGILRGLWTDLEPVSDIVLQSGESVIALSCGGGGYGSPLERPSDRVKHDVLMSATCLGNVRSGSTG